jgi:hypothetical protein
MSKKEDKILGMIEEELEASEDNKKITDIFEFDKLVEKWKLIERRENILGEKFVISFGSWKNVNKIFDLIYEYLSEKYNWPSGSKKMLISYVILKLFVEVWEELDENYKNYYRRKVPNIDEIYNLAKSL